ncbi:MAG TPA: hypothetical protein VML96_04945 [Egibacteraceae bacterium]|nr:hypothetical protein [Egibacteraceae bacterium]
MVRLFALICAAAVALAGCTGGAGGGPEPSPSTPEADPSPSASPTASATASAPATEPVETPSPAPLSSTQWTPLSPAPQALTEVAAAAVGGDIWVVGGLGADGEAVDTVQIYTPAFDSWQEGPPLPEAVHHASLVAAGDQVLLVGGYAGSGFDRPTASVQRFDLATGAWEPGAALPEARAAGAAAWDGARVVYAGGVGPNGLADDVFALQDGAWERVGALNEPREHLAAASDAQGRVWAMGGRTGSLDANLASVELIEGDQISAVGEMPTARGGVAGFWAPQPGACLVGGEQPASTLAEVECIGADGAITALPQLSQPRHGLGAAVVDGIAYVLLGGPQPRLSVSDAVEALLLEASG